MRSPYIELRYWRHDKPIPQGWSRHGGLDGSHHGPREDGTGYMFIVKDDENVSDGGTDISDPDGLYEAGYSGC